MVELLISAVAVYLSLAFIKFCFMAGTLPAAIGTYYRKGEGQVPKWKIALFLIPLNVYVCLVGLPIALYNERFRFFSVYSNYSTMRQIVMNFRAEV
jgi:hypothetical protein